MPLTNRNLLTTPLPHQMNERPVTAIAAENERVAFLPVPAVPLPPTSGHPGWRSKLPVTAIRSAHRSRFKVAHMPRTAGLTAAVP